MACVHLAKLFEPALGIYGIGHGLMLTGHGRAGALCGTGRNEVEFKVPPVIHCGVMNRTTIFVVGLLAALLGSPAWALTPPIGWIASGEDKAVLDAANPGKGMVMEFRIQDAKGLPEEVVAALLKKGIAIERFGIEPNGHINLVGPDYLGRAKLYWASPSVAMWWAVIASSEHVKSLDPDALLMSLQPTPTGVEWGNVEVLKAGKDGTPWGEVDALNKGGEGWGTKATQDPWVQEKAVVGKWEGSAKMRGVTTKFSFFFESNGHLRVQSMTDGKEAVEEGSWATRDGLMRMDIANGGANLPFMITTTTLTVPYAGARLNLYKQ